MADQLAQRSVPTDDPDVLRRQILELVGRYAELAHAPKPFVPGQSSVPVSGKVFGADDMRSLVDSSLDFWLTTGRFNDASRRASPSSSACASC